MFWLFHDILHHDILHVECKKLYYFVYETIGGASKLLIVNCGLRVVNKGLKYEVWSVKCEVCFFFFEAQANETSVLYPHTSFDPKFKGTQGPYLK